MKKAVFLFIGLMSLAGGCTREGVAPPAAVADNPSLVGQVGKVAGGTDVGVGMAPEPGAALKWGEAAGKHDQEVTDTMQVSKQVTFLDYDTPVKVLAESPFRAPELRGEGALVQVKVLSGSHKGDVGWVSTLEFFPDQK